MRLGLRAWLSPTIIGLANRLNYAEPRHLAGLKNAMLRLAGVKVRGRVLISAGFECLHPGHVSIDDGVTLGHNNVLWAFNKIEIGRLTQTARDLLIVSGGHDVASFRPLINQDVSVGPGCWIGARVTILGGVRIGTGCVIGAGSLVNRDIPDWSVAVGTPARVVRSRVPAEIVIGPFGPYSPSEFGWSEVI